MDTLVAANYPCIGNLLSTRNLADDLCTHKENCRNISRIEGRKDHTVAKARAFSVLALKKRTMKTLWLFVMGAAMNANARHFGALLLSQITDNYYTIIPAAQRLATPLLAGFTNARGKSSVNAGPLEMP